MTIRDGAPRDAWDGSLYAANTAHHRQHDDAFLSSVTIRPTDRILDLGCGTGDFTRKLATLVPKGFVTGVDPSESQIGIAARNKPANVELLIGRAQDIENVAEGRKFDLIVSRAVFHWIPEADHPALLSALRARLRLTGFLRVECGGKGQIAAVQAILDAESTALGGPRAPWFFSDDTAYAALLTQAELTTEAGFIRLVQQRRSMPTFDALRSYLESQVFLAYEAGFDHETRATFRSRSLDRAVTELKRTDGTYDLDFVRLDFQASR